MAQPDPPATGADAPARADSGGDDVVTATLRRSPKYAVFLLLGAALGVITALILTLAFNGSQQATEGGYTYSQGQVFGFLTLVCVPVALAIAGGVALLLDRSSARRARELTVAREHFQADE